MDELSSYTEFIKPATSIRQVEVFHGRVRGGRGYLYHDERASGGKLFEANTFTCCHCNSVVIMNPNRKRARASCKKCNALVCDDKVCITECNSIQRSIDKMMNDPHAPVPWLPRGYNGELLFDRSLLDAGKVY